MRSKRLGIAVHQIVKAGLPSLSNATISPSNMASVTFSSLAMLADKSASRFHFIPAAGNEPAAACINVGQCSKAKAIVLQLINPIGALKKVAPTNWDDRADLGSIDNFYE